MKTQGKHRPVRLKLFLILCLASFLLSACGEEADEPVLSSVIEQIPEEELQAWPDPASQLTDAVPGDTPDSSNAVNSGTADSLNTAETEQSDMTAPADAGPDGQTDAPEIITEEAPTVETAVPFTETVPRHDYSSGHGYYYSFLGSAAAIAYDDFFYACENSTGEVNFSAQITESDFYNAWDAFRYDHPEYFWIRSSRQGYADSLGHIVKAEFEIPAGAADLTARLNRAADGVVSGIISLPERDRVRYIYEWIITNTAYSASDNPYDQCAAGVLFNHRAVCAGYADAFQLLCSRAGIRCVTVVGDALNDDGSLRGSHAWNQVQIGSSWSWVDVTWGDPQFADASDAHWDSSFINYGYLCLTDDPFLKSHRIDDMLGRKDVPGHFHASYAGCVDLSQDEYAIRGCLFSSAEEVMSYLMSALAGGQRTISVRLTGDAAYQQTVSALFDGGGIQQILNSLGPSVSECQYFTSPACRTVTAEFR